MTAEDPVLDRGRYRAMVAATPADVERALGLRRAVFRGGGASDRDVFDLRCRHLIVERRDTGETLACCRLLPCADGSEIGQSYSASRYRLDRLAEFEGPLLEIGRFCLAPDTHDPDILRLLWALIATEVDRLGAGLLFGCVSFPGTDPAALGAALGWLGRSHAAPGRWQPERLAPDTLPLATWPAGAPRAALAMLPPLLRTYLGMGGWVGDHLVIDRDLGTCHVFCAVEVARIPSARARALRALAEGGAAGTLAGLPRDL
ncbi:GNAT family N-acetyltransferase [Litorisediminicola beolgyonensis]|uniref:L-ornithine N(alpha)-acyltransferase n=1 Tax=Litorisediminicola beolgyonensis TaxID=1173614 RepID=A0ABW3ZFH9_9RHOB